MRNELGEMRLDSVVYVGADGWGKWMSVPVGTKQKKEEKK